MYSENDWSLPQSSIISACVNNSSHNFWKYSTSFNTIKSLQECFEQFSAMNEKKIYKFFWHIKNDIFVCHINNNMANQKYGSKG